MRDTEFCINGGEQCWIDVETVAVIEVKQSSESMNQSFSGTLF